MNSKYDNLIYYSICENLYENMKITKYSTFTNMCNDIRYNINNDLKLTSEQYKVLQKTLETLNIVYNEHEDKMLKYVKFFFNQKIWKKYMKIIIILNDNLIFAIPK